ncbi:MAG: hypothetical protein HFJ49_02955, partial [Clostridia bacterium]|nr:hypothetical protein [Clostridia bacterium]
GKEDQLLGLKENVIIGKLIPAGTGMQRYQNTQIEVESQEVAEPSEDKEENNTIEKENQEEDIVVNENEALIENDSDFEELDEEE